MFALAGAVFCAALVPIVGPPVGDYHEGATLDCAECHVMHPSRQAGPADLTPWKGAPRRWVGELLRDDVNDLCLACHDEGRAADVLGANRGSQPEDVRQAGFLNRLGRVGVPSTGHTLDSLEMAPGSHPAWNAEHENGSGQGMNCINCHAPHGSQGRHPAYRNLREDAGNNRRGEGLVTYNGGGGGNDLSRDAYVRRPLSYDEADVDFNEPAPSDSGMGRFCAGCHQSFHGAPGSTNVGGERKGATFVRFLRHPSMGVDLGHPGSEAGSEAGSSLARFSSLGNRVKVMSEVGVWDPPGRDVTPMCISCHKAHGNDNPFGLIYRSGSGRVTENGDTGGHTVEHLCGQCHATGNGP